MTLISRSDRAKLKHQTPCTLWLTGLSGAGKSTIANLVEQQLFQLGFHTYLLDGDVVRRGLCNDLGFSVIDRKESVRRIGETAKLMADAGLIVIVATISPLQAIRDATRQLFAPDGLIEIFVDTPLEICEQRDPKGLYRKARAGDVLEFTGVLTVYETPKTPNIHIHTAAATPDECAALVINYLQQHGRLIRGNPYAPETGDPHE